MAHLLSSQQANGLFSLQVLRVSWLARVAPFLNNMARGLAALRLLPTGGFPMRPNFLLPKVVHAVLLQTAQLNLTDTPQFGSLGKPLWNPDFFPLEETQTMSSRQATCLTMHGSCRATACSG